MVYFLLILQNIMEQKDFVKLTNTVYRILEFFPDSDPLKNKAKEKALLIMENPKPEDIDILLSYLKIAKNQGWISGLNCLIIQNEYEKIKKFLPAVVDGRGVKKLDSFELPKRQAEIIKFLEHNEKAQVSDLLSVLPDVTKRTIRRDIDELLKMGKVVRTGKFNQVFYKMS